MAAIPRRARAVRSRSGSARRSSCAGRTALNTGCMSNGTQGLGLLRRQRIQVWAPGASKVEVL